MKKVSRIFALVMAFAMLLSVSAFASGEPSAAVLDPGVQSTANMKPSSYATLDAVNTRAQDQGYIYVGYDVVDGQLTAESNWTAPDYTNITLDTEVEGPTFTAVHASGAASTVNVTGNLALTDSTDGIHASDFTGAGAAFVAADNGKINIKNVALRTEGFVRAGAIVDNGGQVWIEDSSFVTLGANPLTEAWDGYVNSASTNMMLSPPWVLGIQGGIRTINVLDTKATLTVVDSRLASGGWGVISTDGCTQPRLTIIDSELSILPESAGGMNSGWALFGYDEDAYGSGYGAYIIGNCDENFYGSTITGATFGAICREGSVAYYSSNGDITVYDANDNVIGVVAGEGKPTVIQTVFGAMTHSSEDVNISYLDGTVVDTEESTVLYRSSGHGNFTFDNADLRPGNGIIVQMIDDDDSTVGMGDFSTMGFNTELIEAAGMPSTNGNISPAAANNEEVNAAFTNGVYAGDLYNGTGYYGQAGDVMNVTVGQGAVLYGGISLTETFHGVPYTAQAKAVADTLPGVEYVLIDGNFQITADPAQAAYIQFTRFTIDQYYLLCRMENHVYNNGTAGVNVVVSDGGLWKIAKPGVISSLTVSSGTVVGTVTPNADGTLTVAPGATVITSGVYGTVKAANVSASGSMGMGNAGGGEDTSAGGSSEPAAATGSSEPAAAAPAAASSEPAAAAPAAASSEPAAAAPAASGEPAAATAADPKAAYLDYIHQWLLAELAVNSSMTSEQVENEFMPGIQAALDSGDWSQFPVDMLFNGMLNSGVAMTFEEFQAQG